MIYISIDIETGGLSEKEVDILELAAVITDTKDKTTPYREMPTFNWLRPPGPIRIDPKVAEMHQGLLKLIATPLGEKMPEFTTRCEASRLGFSFYNFLFNNGKFGFVQKDSKITFNVAGKNFANFDTLFLKEQTNFFDTVKPHYRGLDPSILYFDEEKDKDTLPNIKECNIRAGLDSNVKHTATEDCWNVIELLRRKI